MMSHIPQSQFWLQPNVILAFIIALAGMAGCYYLAIDNEKNAAQSERQQEANPNLSSDLANGLLKIAEDSQYKNISFKIAAADPRMTSMRDAIIKIFHDKGWNATSDFLMTSGQSDVNFTLSASPVGVPLAEAFYALLHDQLGYNVVRGRSWDDCPLRIAIYYHPPSASSDGN